VTGPADVGALNTGPVRWLTELNVPNARPPRLWWDVSVPEDRKARADADSVICGMGYEPTQDYINQTYGEGFVKKAAPPPPAGAAGTPGVQPPAPGDPGAQPAFADLSAEASAKAGGDPALAVPREPLPQPDAIDELIAELLKAEGWQEVMGPIVDPVIANLADAGSLEEFRDRLAGLVGKMDTGRLQTVLERAGFAARAAGELGAPITGLEEPGRGA
jgi:phage gp29-like protein